MKTTEVEITKDNIGVRIKTDRYGLSLFITNNGWQWTGVDITEETLDMIAKATEQYKKNKKS